MKQLFTLIGVVLILEGLPYAAFPEATRKWLRQLTAMQTGQLRILGFVALACGLPICYVTQRTTLFQ